ncbi:hypothetical protein HU200_001174 [Digitaria exilis]|uniref:Uncharacterized protein n=1 Tax=Digitaria exilis TaxID=1010633 RepID=A0A835FZ39_9POAL|nr:hypothetical protein HU200_001174 [Digitaria exilis]
METHLYNRIEILWGGGGVRMEEEPKDHATLLLRDCRCRGVAPRAQASGGAACLQGGASNAHMKEKDTNKPTRASRSGGKLLYVVHMLLFVSLGFVLGMASISKFPNFNIPFVPSLPSPKQPSSSPPPPTPLAAAPQKLQMGLMSFLPPSGVVAHNMTDEELFWRASMEPKLRRTPYHRVPKIAFLFLVREVLRGAHQELYSIYRPRLDPSYTGSPPKESVFNGPHRIPSQRRGRLLANALLDHANEALRAGIPKHASRCNNFTRSTPSSQTRPQLVDSYDTGDCLARYDRFFAEHTNITIDHWRKGAQWFEMDRAMAVEVVADEPYIQMFRDFCVGRWRCLTDEHYLPTLLSLLGWGERNANRTLTYADWKRPQGMHPHTHDKDEVTEELVRKIREDGGNRCFYNGERNGICNLFARKPCSGWLPKSWALVDLIVVDCESKDAPGAPARKYARRAFFPPRILPWPLAMKDTKEARAGRRLPLGGVSPAWPPCFSSSRWAFVLGVTSSNAMFIRFYLPFIVFVFVFASAAARRRHQQQTELPGAERRRHAHMTDEELYWASVHGAHGSTRTPTAAFPSSPLRPLWEKFFAGHDGLYSIYVHATPPTRLAAGRLRVLPAATFQPAWWKAERRLLANALLDLGNERRASQCSTSPTVYAFLTGSNSSFVDCYENGGSRSRYRHSSPHATSLWHGGERLPVRWSPFADGFCFPAFPSASIDEHYLPTLVSLLGWGRRNANRTLTYADWKRAVNRHPHTHGGEEFSPDALEPLLRLAPKVMGFG